MPVSLCSCPACQNVGDSLTTLTRVSLTLQGSYCLLRVSTRIICSEPAFLGSVLKRLATARKHLTVFLKWDPVTGIEVLRPLVAP